MNKRYQTIKRMIITGEQKEKSAAIEYCDRNGYDVIRAVPRWKGAGHVDFSRFKIVAEKVVSADAK